MKDRVLLMGDVDAIKNYVFEAPGLPQIRGGSQRLVECERQVQEYVESKGGRTIFCSGGGFLFEVPAGQAQIIKRKIERIYIQHTLVATVTVVYEDDEGLPSPVSSITDSWACRLLKAHKEVQQAGNFARRTAFLAARLREAKQKKSIVPFIEAFPFGKRCDICGMRMAGQEITYTEAGITETKRVCYVCLQRHETGRTVRHREFVEFLETKEHSLQSRPPHDLNELVESARRPYVAFLYADGNNIGGLLQQVKTEQEYEALSHGLTEGTKRALFEALWDVCGPALQREKVWPFEILNIGGDDVTLLIQAGYAWEVALTFLEKFEQYVQWQDQPVTASVGIAIADAKHPVRYLEVLASDLLARAKKVARENHASAVNFLWLPNPVAVTQADILMDVYRKDHRLMTARPYTLENARKVQKVVQKLSEWPRSLRYRWGEALEQGIWPSLSLVAYDLARRSEDIQPLLALLEDLHLSDSSPRFHPPVWWWDSKEEVYRTALLDVLELAELRAMRSEIQEEEMTP